MHRLQTASSAVRAAPISVPSSIVPDSCSVTCTCTGRALASLPHRLQYADGRDLWLAVSLARSRLKAHPRRPRSTPRLALRKTATIASKPMCASDGSLVVGPIDPATNRGRSLVENCCRYSRASLAALRLISRTRSRRSNSASTMRGSAKGVGLNDVAAHAEEIRMDVANNVRTAEHQNFAAIFLAPISHRG
jgi:hypothetical protein